MAARDGKPAKRLHVVYNMIIDEDEGEDANSSSERRSSALEVFAQFRLYEVDALVHVF